MANSKYEYVKQFELNQVLLPHTFIVIRIDGKGFHKFSKQYNFQKPNDENALNLMNDAAKIVMQTFQDIWIAYGQSDEYSFVLTRDSTLYNRRSDKISSVIGSCFTSAYQFYFQNRMGKSIQFPYLPVFDSRCVCYPDMQTLKDYLSWRQVDCHVNNLYNTCFWSLVKSGLSEQQAEQKLSKTTSGDKNEILFSQFNLNYNDINDIFKKGSIIIKQKISKIDQQGEVQKQSIDLGQIKDEDEKISRKQRKKLKYKDQLQNTEDQQDIEEYIIKEEFWQKFNSSLIKVI